MEQEGYVRDPSRAKANSDYSSGCIMRYRVWITNERAFPMTATSGPRSTLLQDVQPRGNEFYRDLHKYYDALNAILEFMGSIFARRQAYLFSAVELAFIANIQQGLRITTRLQRDRLHCFDHTAQYHLPSKLDVPVASCPKASAVQDQSILFNSLASAPLAAFLCMLWKQWFGLCIEGSPIDHNLHRELRMRDVSYGTLKSSLDVFPLVAQASFVQVV